MKSLTPYLWVGLGGFLGANARLLVARASAALLGTAFPHGTFIINITGSFVLGLVATLINEGIMPHGETMRYAVSIGFLGAYTTFSTFEYESHGLLEDGNWLYAAGNMVGSLIVGLVAVRLGIVLGKRFA